MMDGEPTVRQNKSPISGDNFRVQHDQTRNEYAKDCLLRLPAELLIQTLGYVVPQDTIVNMKAGKVSRERKRWNTEIERLKNPNWTRPKRSGLPGYMLTCPELYLSAVEAFWGGNVFHFASLDELQQFLGFTTEVAKRRVQQISLYDAVCPESFTPLTMYSSLTLSNDLPKLTALRLSAECFKIQDPEGSYENNHLLEMLDRDPWNRSLHDRLLDGLRARDAALEAIPPSTFAMLTSLKIRSRRMVSYLKRPRPLGMPTAPTWEWDEAEVLDYARDLRTSAWKQTSFWQQVETPLSRQDKKWYRELWEEARAAVYFDEAYCKEEGETEATDHQKRLRQWCTWSVEWASQVLLREINFGIFHAGLKPRSFDELFEVVDGMIKAREEHSRELYVLAHPEHRILYEW